MAVFLSYLDGKVLHGELPAGLHSDAEVSHQLYLPGHSLLRQAVLGDLGRAQASNELLALEHRDVGVAKPS